VGLQLQLSLAFTDFTTYPPKKKKTRKNKIYFSNFLIFSHFLGISKSWTSWFFVGGRIKARSPERLNQSRLAVSTRVNFKKALSAAYNKSEEGKYCLNKSIKRSYFIYSFVFFFSSHFFLPFFFIIIKHNGTH
jgi:hypothetical protein